MLDTQIVRARNLKIHLHGSEQFDSRLQIAIFQRLAECSFLWEELSISLTSDLGPLLATLRDRVPLLRRLWVFWNSAESQGEESIDCFDTACGLVDATIYSQYRFIPIHLPAHQLTRYDIDGPWAAHRSILKAAPNLVEARISINFDEEAWPEQEAILDLSRLRRLYVSHTNIFNYLRTPALQELACNFWRDDPNQLLLPDLDRFLIRSACNLRRVCLRGSPDVPTSSEILQKYPSVTELMIITPSIGLDLATLCKETNALISHLTIPNPTGSATVSPQLSAINFGCETESYMDYDLYLKMLESRWRAEGCALKSAALLTESGPGPNPATLDGFASLRKDGLDLLMLHGQEGGDVMGAWMYAPQWT
ncbi:hypothetical protein B0H17DRAFT_1062243 [Mycena rosella]|uniref:Uncharacterized protein n=1 Tax=Mycena rosella TaxID=1033263 RepID=A0AAD7DJX9_MYCRO|nr:hypothetical protein B0H17DRAFT_1062243 [Mycena rosella]